MSEPDQVLPPAIPVKGGATLGRIGMAVSFITPLVFLLMLLIKPGWGSPIRALGGLAIITTTPASFILSLIGLIRDRTKWPSIVGLAVSGLFVAVFILVLATAFMRSASWR